MSKITSWHTTRAHSITLLIFCCLVLVEFHISWTTVAVILNPLPRVQLHPFHIPGSSFFLGLFDLCPSDICVSSPVFRSRSLFYLVLKSVSASSSITSVRWQFCRCLVSQPCFWYFSEHPFIKHNVSLSIAIFSFMLTSHTFSPYTSALHNAKYFHTANIK